MTILTVLLLTVVSTCLAQPADNDSKQRPGRAPQSQIQYSDPDGLKVDWKLYAPQNQWRSHLESTQRAQRAETGTSNVNFSPKQQTHVAQAPVESVPQYQPYSAVPHHIKQLIANVYTPEGPYVDPGAFFYKNVVPAPVASFPSPVKEDQSAISPTHQIERTYFNSAVNYRINKPESNARKISTVPVKVGIKYKDEEKSSERSSLLPYGIVLDVQAQEKTEYQPYKHIGQSQYGQYNEKSAPTKPQYGQYIEKFTQARSGQYKKQDYQSQPQNRQYRTRSPQEQPQYGQYNNQISQENSPNRQYTQQATQVQPQYTQYNNQASQSQQYKQTPNFQSIKPVSQINFQKNMPMAIQQLLSYQSQLPYNVIANHILYRPKQLFVPKPLPESAKIGKQYPSKIYFVKTDGQIYDSPEIAKQAENEKRY